MAICKFVEELVRLRKSSQDSIDNINNFNTYKKYMHVTRNVEEDLKGILSAIEYSGKKTLLLLCGSSGDGKSHLLSYLKNELKLLEDYTIWNDATESSGSTKTAIETLNELLISFSDININDAGKNVILAINLGVLSNFIESSYGENYKLLREYVEENNILSIEVEHSGYIENSNFQHINFSDYHMYTLKPNGVSSVYILDILARLFNKTEDNPFYSNYKDNCMQCPMAEKCPVKHNYEFLMGESVRFYIANSLIEVIIKEKEILTTRDILNYVYDILVAYRFSYKTISNASTDTATFLKEYLSDITPALMYDYTDMTLLLNHLKKYDPLLKCSEATDEWAIFYYVSSDVSKKIKSIMEKTPYSTVINKIETINKLNGDKVLKAQIFNILIRLNAIMENNHDDIFQNFLSDLYYYNLRKVSNLSSLYDLVERAIKQWCGSLDTSICLDESHSSFTLYENIKFEPYLNDLPHPKSETELEKFTSSIVVKFENIKTKEVIALNIDYSLYELLYKLKNGYVQTADDRNKHADFISFIEKILKAGSAEEFVLVMAEDGRKASIERTKFGYRFKVVK